MKCDNMMNECGWLLTCSETSITTGAAPEFWQQGTDTTLNQKRHGNMFRIGGANLGQALADSLSSQPLKLTATGFDAFKVLVTDDVAGQLSELDLTGSTFEANVDFFSLQQFRNVRTLRLAQCRKLTDGGPLGEHHTDSTDEEPRLEVLDLSECPSIKGMGAVFLEICVGSLVICIATVPRTFWSF